MFADRAKIYIRSGKGGDGHASFRRELYVPKRRTGRRRRRKKAEM